MLHTKRKELKPSVDRFILLSSNGHTFGGYDSENIVIFGDKMSKPEKRKLFKVLAKQLGYEIK